MKRCDKVLALLLTACMAFQNTTFMFADNLESVDDEAVIIVDEESVSQSDTEESTVSDSIVSDEEEPDISVSSDISEDLNTSVFIEEENSDQEETSELGIEEELLLSAAGDDSGSGEETGDEIIPQDEPDDGGDEDEEPEPIQLHEDFNEIVFGDEWEVWCSLQFDPNKEQKLRYKIEADDPETFMYCQKDGENVTDGLGQFYLIDNPDSEYLICVNRSSDEQSSVNLTVTKYPSILSIEPVTTPDIVGGMELFAFDEYRIKIHYEDSTYDEELRLNDFCHQRANGEYYSDSELTQQIDNLKTYEGIAYTKVTLGDEPAWSFIASFNVTPMNEDDYPLIIPDDRIYTIEAAEFSGETVPKKMFRIQVDEAGIYEFVGENIAIYVPQSEPQGGDYYPEVQIGTAHAYLEADREYFVTAMAMREDEDNLPEQGTIRCHKQVTLESIDVELLANGNLTTRDWGLIQNSLYKVFTYRDPESGAKKTVRTLFTDPLPTDEVNYFDMFYTEFTKVRENIWKASVEPGFGREAYGNVSCEKYLDIPSVFIADGVDVSVTENTEAKLDYTYVCIESDLLDGIAVSPDTLDNYDNVRWDDKTITLTLEIDRVSDQTRMQPVEGMIDSATESILQSFDAQVVLRGDDQILGSIVELPLDLEMAVKVNGYDAQKGYSIFRVLEDGTVEELKVSKVTQDGSTAQLWFRSNKTGTFAVIEGRESSYQSETWEQVINFGPDEWSRELNLTFDSDGNRKLRYKLECSDPEAEIGYTVSNGSSLGKGIVYINDFAGTDHQITVTRSSEQMSTVTLTATRMEVTSIEALNMPTLVLGTDYFGYDDIMVGIHYADGSYVECKMYDFDPGCESNEGYYEDEDLLHLIEDPDGYTGPAYTVLMPGGEFEWRFIAKFMMLPFDEDNYPDIVADNTVYTIDASEPKKMYKITVDTTAVYEFVGQNAGVAVFNSGNNWGGYYPNWSTGSSHGILEAGRQYMVMVQIREDSSGNYPAEYSFRCHRQAFLKSVALEIPTDERLSWNTVMNRIMQVFTYEDPEDGEEKTFRAPLFGLPMDDSGNYFEMDTYMEQVDPANPNLYQITLLQGLDHDSYGRYKEEAGYAPVSCTQQIEIDNYYIAPEIASSVTVGVNTASAVDASRGAVLNEGAGASGTAVSQDTLDQLESAKAAKRNISANLEIGQGSNDADMQLIQQQAASTNDSILQLLDAQIVLRGDDMVLGTINETPQEIEMSVKVTDYDPDKTYSVLRVHNGVVEELDIKRVEQNGTDAVLWFASDKFSTFAVEVSETPADEDIPVIKCATLELEGMIILNMYATIPDDTDSAEMTFEVTREDGTVNTTVAEWNSDNYKMGEDDDGKEVKYYRFSLPLAAKQMSDQVTAKLTSHAGGETKSSGTINYSVEQYCRNQLTSEKIASDPNLRNLLGAMLEYGASAQTYFNYGTSHPATAALEVMGASDREAVNSAVSAALHTQDEMASYAIVRETTEDAAVSITAATLLLEASTTVRIRVNTDLLGQDYKLYCRNKGTSSEFSVPFKRYNDQSSCADITGIAAQDLDDIYEIYVGDANGNILSDKLSYGPMTYAYNKWNSTVTNLPDLVKKLQVYNVLAEKYFNN